MLKKIGFFSLFLRVFAIFYYYMRLLGTGTSCTCANYVNLVMSCVQFHSYHHVSSLCHTRIANHKIVSLATTLNCSQVSSPPPPLIKLVEVAVGGWVSNYKRRGGGGLINFLVQEGGLNRGFTVVAFFFFVRMLSLVWLSGLKLIYMMMLLFITRTVKCRAVCCYMQSAD